MKSEVGDIVRGWDIGMLDSSARRKFVWTRCPRCDQKRWVRFDGASLQSGERYCKSCVAVLQDEIRHGHKAYGA